MNETKSNKGLIIFLVLLVLVLASLVVLLATETISFKSILNKEETTKVEKDTNQKDEKINEVTEVEEVKENKAKEPVIDEEDAPVSTSNSKKQKSSVETSKILEYYKDRVAVCATDSSNTEYKYALVDINDDDIPELILYTGGFLGSTIIGEFSVYTYDENIGSASSHYIVSVGTIQGRLNLNTML